jgi:hypothetical protein
MLKPPPIQNPHTKEEWHIILDEWYRISLKIADYKKMKDRTLISRERMVIMEKDRVKETNSNTTTSILRAAANNKSFATLQRILTGITVVIADMGKFDILGVYDHGAYLKDKTWYVIAQSWYVIAQRKIDCRLYRFPLDAIFTDPKDETKGVQ